MKLIVKTHDESLGYKVGRPSKLLKALCKEDDFITFTPPDTMVITSATVYPTLKIFEVYVRSKEGLELAK